MTENRVLAWHGNPNLKEDTLRRMKEHAEQDQFIRGSYLALRGEPEGVASQWGGCLHGCLTAENLAAEKGVSMIQFAQDYEADVSWHDETERIFGISARVGSTLDLIYEDEEDLPPAEVAIQLLEAIPVGADLKGLNLYDREGDGNTLPLPEVLEILRNAPVPGQEEDK